MFTVSLARPLILHPLRYPGWSHGNKSGPLLPSTTTPYFIFSNLLVKNIIVAVIAR
jgi:hypothetical protein